MSHGTSRRRKKRSLKNKQRFDNPLLSAGLPEPTAAQERTPTVQVPSAKSETRVKGSFVSVFSSWMWRIVVTVGTLLGIFVAWATLQPEFRIVCDEWVDPRDPFATPLYIRNESLTSLEDVKISCTVETVFNVVGYPVSTHTIPSTTAIFVLGPNDTSGFYCISSLSGGAAPSPISAAEAVANVSFRPRFWPFRITVVQHLQLQPDYKHNLRWSAVRAFSSKFIHR